MKCQITTGQLRFLSLVFFVFGFCLAIPKSAFTEDKPAKEVDAKGEALKKVWLTFCKGIVSMDEKERLEAIANIMPTKQDSAVLFPKNADEAWKKMEQQVDIVKQLNALGAAEFKRAGAIKDIKAVDLRKKDSGDSHQKLLKVIPKDIPVYGLHIVSENGLPGYATAFVFVNNRWVHIRNLDSFPEALGIK